ncbi:hypothetical protein XENOCAPTIV_011439, partial [Xenoophorus captivus]
VTNPMQIMFSVLRGKRPDTSQDSLSVDIPSRETLISIMTCGWTANPDERPSFLSTKSQLLFSQHCTSQASSSGSYSPQEENVSLPGALISTNAASSKPDHSPPLHHSPPSQGPVARWIATRREDIVLQMTEACLNQSLDALLARSMLMREDYELVVNQPTRTAKVRQLLDNCHKHDENFCRIVVRKLVDNNQGGLKPYPPEISFPTTTAVPSAPPLSLSYRNL